MTQVLTRWKFGYRYKAPCQSNATDVDYHDSTKIPERLEVEQEGLRLRRPLVPVHRVGLQIEACKSRHHLMHDSAMATTLFTYM